MTILVTGGCGYIGSHTVYALRSVGRNVVVVDNLSTGALDLLPGDVEVVIGDVSDADLVSRVMAERSVTAIIHFAAKIKVDESNLDPLLYYQENTCKMLSLLRSAINFGIKTFIFSSTAAVYGDVVDAFISENAPLAPINPYGRSKYVSEVMLSDASRAYGINIGILRYFNVIGSDPLLRTGSPSSSATHLLSVALQTALGEREYVEVYGADYQTKDGTGVRDYVHVSDLADAHLSCLKFIEDGNGSLVANVGYGKGFSVFEVLSAVERVTKKKVPFRVIGRRNGDPEFVVADNTRLKNCTEWKPNFNNLEFCVDTAYRWYRKRFVRS
jgi:UDP-glucose 4-epimerase